MASFRMISLSNTDRGASVVTDAPPCPGSDSRHCSETFSSGIF